MQGEARRLQELQRRVANSLQIIASVLMQSARRVRSEETRGHLHDAHRRAISFAALQKQVAVPSDERVVHTAKVDGSGATANVSASLGLIVTELVINALNHAFPPRTRLARSTLAIPSKALGSR